MTGIAVLAVLVVAALGFAWSRMTTSRAERRSVDAYERQLDVLGHVAQRSEAGAVIKKPTASELARPHVQPSDTKSSFQPARNEYPSILPPRVRLEPPVPPITANRSTPLPVFGDDVEPITGRPLDKVTEESFGKRSKMFRRHRAPKSSKRIEHTEQLNEERADLTISLEPVPSAPSDYVPREVEEPLFALESLVSDPPPPPPLPIVFDAVSSDDHVPVRQPAHRSTRQRRISDHTHRRALTGTAAAILVAAIAFGGWQIAAKPKGTTPHISTGASQRSHITKPHNTSPFNNAPGSSLQPVTNSGGIVTYPAPSGTYTISFTSLDSCWVGIEPGSTSSGNYLAMQTLTSADSWTYQATGAILVRIGAPKTLSVKINGETVALPATVQAYDITFVPSGETSA